MGWTGGYVLVALLLAPYLRKFGQFTIPDFLGARYGGNIVRSLGVIAAIIASFTYVVAQIYGVGLITSRFTGLEFGIGVFVGLAGILVCSFLGGMKAVTWTQVAQYVILIIAYMIPVVWLSVKHTGIPIPQLVYGTGAREGHGAREGAHQRPGREAGSPDLRGPRQGGRRQDQGPAGAATRRRRMPSRRSSRTSRPPPRPRPSWMPPRRPSRTSRPTPKAAEAKWKADKAGAAGRTAPPKPHATPYPGKDEKARDLAKWNFIGIVFCMMFGTAALPHILMRYYTTPSVQEARVSVFWSLFFIFLLYFTAPALAVLAKFDVYTLHRGIEVRRSAGLGERVAGRWTRRSSTSPTSTRTASCSSPRS